MDIAAYLRGLAGNNAWANHRLLSACARLDAAALAAPRTGFFPSIIASLNHILTVDWFYVSALEGNCIGRSAFDPEIPCPGFADLDREQRAVDRRLVAVCEEMTPARLAAPCTLIREGQVQEEPAGRVLMHLFQHQIHHRGQVHGMLSGTGVPPPQLDEFFLTAEVPLRQAEMAEIGLDEARIWRRD